MKAPEHKYDEHGPYLVFDSELAKAFWPPEKYYTRKFVKGEVNNPAAQRRELVAANNLVRQYGYPDPPSQNDGSSPVAESSSSGTQRMQPSREPPREFRPTSMPTRGNNAASSTIPTQSSNSAPNPTSKPSLAQRIINMIKN